MIIVVAWVLVVGVRNMITHGRSILSYATTTTTTTSAKATSDALVRTFRLKSLLLHNR
jgi:hypothetical protein